ncbi:WXG100-like domain-containing protein [Sphaerisporangium corydalis]
MLPPALETAFGMLGVPWPTEDEDGLRECAAAYRACATTLTGHTIPLAHGAVQYAVAGNSGDGVDALGTLWAGYYQDGDETAHLPSLATTLHGLADAHDLAADLVQALKAFLIGAAVYVTAVLLWAAASAAFTAGMGAVQARTLIAGLRGAAQRSVAVFRRELERFFGRSLVRGVETRLRRILGARGPVHNAMVGDGVPGARRFTPDELRLLTEAEANGQRALIDRLGPFAPRLDLTSSPLHPGIAREFTTALDRLAERFPRVTATLKEVGVRDPRNRFDSVEGLGAYSVLAGDGRGIYIDARRLGDPDLVRARFTANVDSGWLANGWQSPQALVYHEFGHHLLANLPASAERELNQAFRDVVGRRVDVQSGMFHPATAARVSDELGAYAATEPHEMIAEAFAEYMSSSSPRPLAAAIGESLERIFR